MTIALVSIAAYGNNLPDFVRVFAKHQEEYCRKYGIKYVQYNEAILRDKSPHWSKFPAVRKELDECADWVIWMDADAFPINKDKSIENYLNTVRTPVVMRKDRLGWNNGVFAFRNCPESCVMLDWLESEETYRRFSKVAFIEQAAMAHYMDNAVPDIVTIPPDSFGFNQYPTEIYGGGIPNKYKEGDWCVHFPAGFGKGSNLMNFCKKRGLWDL